MARLAKHLSYYTELHDLFPDIQFGRWPSQNTEQVLLILANTINYAWLKGKVITLVAFKIQKFEEKDIPRIK